MYETFPHTADLGLRVRAENLEALFSEAALGLLAMMVANPDSVQPVEEVSVNIAADDVDLQLFDWLSELLFQFDTQRMLFCEFDVRIDAGALSAVCRGEPMDPARHRMDHEVKAVTYHHLIVERTADGWLAEVIVDI